MTAVHIAEGKNVGPDHTLLLLSGGLDSAACAGFYSERRRGNLSCLFMDYGQAAAALERQAAKAIARHYSLPIHEINWENAMLQSNGVILGRNAVIIFAALMHLAANPGRIVLGIHSGTRYYDCSQDFVASAQAIIDGYTGGKVRISAPFLHWDKGRIWDFCSKKAVPVGLTYSCERGLNPPCGSCLSCRDLELLKC